MTRTEKNTITKKTMQTQQALHENSTTVEHQEHVYKLKHDLLTMHTVCGTNQHKHTQHIKKQHQQPH
jgi:hypothetical protein